MSLLTRLQPSTPTPRASPTPLIDRLSRTFKPIRAQLAPRGNPLTQRLATAKGVRP